MPLTQQEAPKGPASPFSTSTKRTPYYYFFHIIMLLKMIRSQFQEGAILGTACV